MDSASWWTVCILATDFLIRLGLSVRVIMRRLPIGVSLAWLFVVLTFPFIGALSYLFVGELRLGQAYAARAAQLRVPFRGWMTELRQRTTVDWAKHPPSSEALARMCQVTIGMPVTSGNRLELLPDHESAFRSLIRDIDAAQRTCHLEFYIWNQGGVADEVGEALLRAAARGVTCQLLLDDVGSREFLRSEWADRLRDGKVALLAALPARFWRLAVVRFDLRLHRKLAVIDGRIGYTGSLNVVDPRYFKQSAGVGQWIDAMVRLEGPTVEPMQIIFLSDWAMESFDTIDHLRQTANVRTVEPQGTALVQVIPSGPAHDGDGAMEEILVGTIFSAQRNLVLTTPYFVPDESLLRALMAAARRGVRVTLIMPAKVDSRLARLASRSIQGDLVAAGVNVLLFEGGLLHTKSVTVDDELSLFGSLNLDPRSLHLNFEITLAIYDTEFTSRLAALQQEYAKHSRPLELAAWRARGLGQKFIENAARLLGPLL